MKKLHVILMTVGISLVCNFAVSQSSLGVVNRRDCMGPFLARWSLCSLNYIDQGTPQSDGGPQANEGYVRVSHQIGTVGLAIGTLGNMELAAGSRAVVKDARSIQGGIVVSGPGYVEHVTALQLTRPLRMGGYTGPINIERADYVTFDEHWSIRPNEDDLLICRDERCVSFSALMANVPPVRVER